MSQTRQRLAIALLVAAAVALVVAIPYWALRHAAISKVDALVAALDSNDPYKSEAAENQLARLAGKTEIRRLVWHLGDEGRPFETRIAVILARIGEPAIRPTVDALVSSTVRGNGLLDWLSSSKRLPSRVTTWLDGIRLRREGRQAGLRTRASAAFSLMGNPGAEYLLATIRGTPMYRFLASALLYSNPCPESVTELVRLLGNSDRLAADQARSVLAILAGNGCIAPETASADTLLVDKLTKDASTGRSNAACGAAMVLAAADNPQADAEIAHILSGDDAVARVTMARALAARGDSRAVGPMIEALMTDLTAIPIDHPSPYDRTDRAGGFAWAMAYLDDDATLDALIQAFSGSAESIRANAAGVLSLIAHRSDTRPSAKQRALEVLRTALNDADTEKRFCAARVLAEQGEAAAFPVLLEEAASSDPQQRFRAVMGMGFLKTDKAAQAAEGLLADKDAKVRNGAAFAIGWAGKPAFPALKRILAGPDSDIADIARMGMNLSEFHAFQEGVLRSCRTSALLKSHRTTTAH